MKRITIYLLALILLSACADDFDNKNAPMNNVAHFKTTEFTAYEELPSGSFPAINGYFSPLNDAVPYLKSWLVDNYFSCDVGSTITLSYNFMDYDRADSLNQMSSAYSTLDAVDYKEIWGMPVLESFTPQKSATDFMPKVLSKKFSELPNETYKIVAYNEAEEEPTIEKDKHVTYYKQDFSFLQGQGGGWGGPLSHEFFDNHFIKNISGKGRNWGVFTYNPKGMCIYHSAAPGADGWYITYELNLGPAEHPVFQCAIGKGYHTGFDGLSCLITEEFDGENPLKSKWVDVTGRLKAEDGSDLSSLTPWKGYPQVATKFSVDLSDFAGKRIYLSFRSVVPADAVGFGAPFWVVTDINFDEVRDVAEVSSTEVKYAAYKKQENTWVRLESVYVLQTRDYADIKQEYLSVEKAHEVIPTILDRVVEKPKVGEKLVVVYKQLPTITYAESYLFGDSGWEYEGLPELIKKTSNFILADFEQKWIENK